MARKIDLGLPGINLHDPVHRAFLMDTLNRWDTMGQTPEDKARRTAALVAKVDQKALKPKKTPQELGREKMAKSAIETVTACEAYQWNLDEAANGLKMRRANLRQRLRMYQEQGWINKKESYERDPQNGDPQNGDPVKDPQSGRLKIITKWRRTLSFPRGPSASVASRAGK